MEIMENMNKCLNIQNYLKNSIFKKHPIILNSSKISKKYRNAKEKMAIPSYEGTNKIKNWP